MAFSISTGKVSKPYKVIIYGPEGIGKSTFAAHFPAPLFSDTEGSTIRMDVPRIDPAPKSWEELLAQAEWVQHQPEVCETYVIDTADWAERLCQQSVVKKANKTSVEDWGYGKGYTYVAEEFGKLIDILTDIVNRGDNVVITAHAAMRKFEQPDEMGSYDRWELKMHKLISTRLKEWADMVLFVNYKTIVVTTDSGKGKAQGGKRVMYAVHNPCWDAKNRDGLPDEMPFEFAQIAHLFKTSPADQRDTTDQPIITPDASDWDGIPDKLKELMMRDGIQPDELMYLVSHQKGYFPPSTPIKDYPKDFVDGWCIAMWDQVKAAIAENKNNLPF